jgi:putative transposase
VCHKADQWPWSSYNIATAGKQAKSAWLNTDWLLANFGLSKRQTIAAYRVFVAAGEGQPSPWADLRNQAYLGDAGFVIAMQALIDGDK